MADGSLGYSEAAGTVPTTTRRRPGSEIIRRRVAQPLQPNTTLVSTDPSRDSSGSRYSLSPDFTHNTAVAPGHQSDSRDMLASISHSSRSLKRKSATSTSQLASNRPENRNANTCKTLESSSYVHSPRISDNLTCPPPLDHRLPPVSSQKKSKTLAVKHTFHHPHDSHITRPYHESDDNTYRHIASGESVFTGPLSVAEFERMKKEIEALKEALHETKKASKRHSKKLEENKAELSATFSMVQTKELELSAVQEKHKKAEELLSTIESSVQCQICMDLPDKPFALSPCGHVLCLSCLQEWFRKAPPTLDDMDIDPEELTDPHYILMRSISCPSCRATVRRRPVPVFMVKAVASALKKRNTVILSPGEASTSIAEIFAEADDDPWKGIFVSSDEGEDDDNDNDSDFDADSDEDGHQVLMGWYRRAEYFPQGALHSDSDADDDEDSDDEAEDDDASNPSEVEDEPVYILPQWAPPRVIIDATHYNTPESMTLKLLQRGCTWSMIRSYDLAYHHRCGITLSLPSLNFIPAPADHRATSPQDFGGVANRIYLGWNITVDHDDSNGMRYMTEVLDDIKNNPERWEVRSRPGFQHSVDVRRLVRADETEDYDTTDTEVWIDASDF